MMLARLIRVLTLLAVLLAPTTMMASHAAAAPMPAPHAVDGAKQMAGHCPKSDEQDEQKQAAAIDCTIICSAMPEAAKAFTARLPMVQLALLAPSLSGSAGLNPAAEPPPPRLA